jgi:addiction module RelB/DinJ family antitoxin
MMGAAVQTTIRLDGEVKRQFEEIINSLGMNMTTAISLFANATIRHQGIPFDLSLVADPLNDPITKAKILSELERRTILADDPNTKWFSTEEARKELGL